MSTESVEIVSYRNRVIEDIIPHCPLFSNSYSIMKSTRQRALWGYVQKTCKIPGESPARTERSCTATGTSVIKIIKKYYNSSKRFRLWLRISGYPKKCDTRTVQYAAHMNPPVSIMVSTLACTEILFLSCA